MSVDVGSVLLSTNNLASGFIYQTLDGTNIAEEYVTVAGLASGDNGVLLPAAIVNLPLTVIPVTAPDGLLLLVKSFALVTMTPSSPLVYDSGTTYAINKLVTYNGITYVSLQDSNTGNTPGSSPTYWQLGSATMTRVVLNAANTAAGGCELVVKVGVD